MKRIVWLLIGLGLGALITFFLTVALMMTMEALNVHRARVPVVMFFLPLIGAFFGYKNSELLSERVSQLSGYDFSQWGVMLKVFLFGSLCWTAVVSLYVFLFEPYGYMGDDDWLHFLLVVVMPIVVSGGIALIYKRLFH